ncbi:MAG TPA: phosphoribosylanthranilate isomerase, partial [Chloroflexota bacterium]|nr:phosphoribosylanthranilate isomerase [Chloroflexota bacterium]
MNPLVKICGLREVEHARVAVEAGADYLGFVFAPTRRYVAPEIVGGIIRELPRAVPTVGLFVNAAAETVREIFLSCGLDFVQLCGDESRAYCAALGLPVIKSLRVRGAEVAAEVERYAPLCHWVQLDGFQPGAFGGTGTTFDWHLARELAKSHRIMLAGGLSAENVAEAIGIAQPWGVDVSSGVETDGKKDPEKIRAFIEAAR